MKDIHDTTNCKKLKKFAVKNMSDIMQIKIVFTNLNTTWHIKNIICYMLNYILSIGDVNFRKHVLVFYACQTV